jgi:hypothetical protein
MNFPSIRASKRRRSAPSGLAAAPRMFLALAEGDELPQNQRTLPRKAFVVFATVMALLVAPLYWAGSAQGSDQDGPQAILVKQSGDDDSDDDDDDDDRGDTNGNTTGNNDTTGNNANRATGHETQANNTDKSGLNTGVSTRGETDTGDHTGKTERR